MREICLYNLEQAGLVVSHPTGLTFFNLGGPDGQQRYAAEGFFVPLSSDPPDPADPRLGQLLADACRACAPLTLPVADTIDEILQQVSSSDRLQVDRSRLQAGAPGWVPVQVLAGGDFSQLQGFSECAAFLTWPHPR